jgi:vacuolar-type H+-ATPase subunit D/Vma8
MTRAEAVCSAVQRIVRNRPEDDDTGILARAVLELLVETERLEVGEQTLGSELMRTKLFVRRLKKKLAPRSKSVIRVTK